jgi:HSP20 family protein
MRISAEPLRSARAYFSQELYMIIVRRSVRRTPVNVQREMERVFRSWVPQPTSIPVISGRSWRPALEVLESDDAFVITAELAGIDESSLDVTIDGEILTIAGNRPGMREEGACSYREAGISYGDFSAEIFIPGALSIDDAEASYINGMLRIRLPKAIPAPSTPRKINLTSNADKKEES